MLISGHVVGTARARACKLVRRKRHPSRLRHESVAASRTLSQDVRNNLDAVYGGAVPVSLFERLNDHLLSNSEILSAMFEIIDRVREQ